MSEPSSGHIGALGINFVWHNLMSAGEAARAAETVLTSTDPRVLDAMQDALVRAGRLRVDESIAYSDDDGETWYAMFGRAPSREPMCRLVTEWESA